MAKKDKRPTIKDVAEQCGVSTATVSAVINRADWVPAETRVRVERAIRALGYRPNRLAQGLKTRQSNTVGVIVSDITNPFFTDIVRSLSHALGTHDRNLVLCDADHRFDLGARNFRMLLEKQVDAMVLIGDSVGEEDLGAYLAQGDPMPIVAIEREYPFDGVSMLLIDSEESAAVATQHLIEHGYTRIGMITGPSRGPGSTSYARVKQEQGYRRALRDAGLDYDEQLVTEGDFRYPSGQQAMRRLMALAAPPRAVLAANDMMALGAMQVAHELGLNIPGDVAVVGYDDIPMVAHTFPPLTTLAVPRREIGEAAAELVLSNLVHPEAPQVVRRMFSTTLVVRASSVPARASQLFDRLDSGSKPEPRLDK